MAEAKETLVDGRELRDSRGSEKPESFHPLVELTAMRVREFLREKEAVFWVFIFPVLMTFALGIAFRNTVPDKTPVAIETSAEDSRATETANVLSHSSDITATVMSPSEATQALRSGKVAIVVKPGTDSFDYRFDQRDPRVARLVCSSTTCCNVVKGARMWRT